MRGLTSHTDVHLCGHNKPQRSCSKHAHAQHRCHLPQQFTNLRQFRPQHRKQHSQTNSRLAGLPAANALLHLSQSTCFLGVCVFSGCKVFALDAAMPFDFETKASARLRAQTSLRVGIVGFGTFGQFLAKRLVQQGHKVSLRLCLHHTQQHDANLNKMPYNPSHSCTCISR